MQVERWPITTREEWLQRRRANINGSEIGALFGFSPFLTPYALYADKAGLVDRADEDNSAMKRGRVMEPSILAAIQEDHPDWHVFKAGDYLCSPEFRIGCTPDFYVNHPERGHGVIQGKTVAKPIFDEEWQDGPPQWIVLQTLQEMMLSDMSWGAVAAFVTTAYGYELHMFPFERHAGAELRIKTAAKEFWANVEIGKAPAPDWYRDDDVIKSMFPRDNGTTIDLSKDNRLPVLLEEYESLNAMGKHAADKLKAVKAEIAAKIGEASAARLPGWEITNKLQRRKGHVVKDSEFRVLRVKRTEEARAAA